MIQPILGAAPTDLRLVPPDDGPSVSTAADDVAPEEVASTVQDVLSAAAAVEALEAPEAPPSMAQTWLGAAGCGGSAEPGRDHELNG